MTARVATVCGLSMSFGLTMLAHAQRPRDLGDHLSGPEYKDPRGFTDFPDLPGQSLDPIFDNE